jgi:hypothetical protein
MTSILPVANKIPAMNGLLRPLSNPLENAIKLPIIITLIVLYQGLFSGNAITVPSNLKAMFNNQIFRFVSLLAIALTATKDIEYSIISVLIFLTIMYLLKTPKERKETGFV